MTVKELSQLYYINRSIEHMREQLAEMRQALDVRSPSLSDMPKAPGAHDRIGDLVPRIADEEARIRAEMREMERVRAELTGYINTVPNVRIRLIMQLRFLRLLTWQEVADVIGGKETEYSVKQSCYRFLKGRE